MSTCTARQHLVLVRTPHSPLTADPYHRCFASTSSSSPVTSTPHHLPVLATSFTNAPALAHLVKGGPKGRYGGVIVTSARASDAWGRASAADRGEAEEAEGGGGWDAVPFFVVGKGTRDALLKGDGRRNRIAEDKVLGAEETGTGDKLARFIVQHFALTAGSSTTTALPLLYLVGDKNKDTIEVVLRSAGIGVERLQVYETTKTTEFDEKLEGILDGIEVEEEEQVVVWFALFSPSGSKHCLSALRRRGLLPLSPSTTLDDDESPPPPTRLSRSKRVEVRLAAIGPVTKAFLEQEEGVEAHAMAESPEPEELLKALRGATRSAL
ncbi:uroporphyrinogen-III synthase [Pseudohyphozyma bogoriensis]|nr:uroporphyrinogen-III synthase [Pseudohyphozyma bogoriensis]